MNPEPIEPLSLARRAKALAWGVLSGLGLVITPYAIWWLYCIVTGQANANTFTSASGFGFGLILLFPLVQGFVMARWLGPKRQSVVNVAGLVLLLALIEFLLAALVLREGFICLLIASPIVIALMAFGALLGRVFARLHPIRSVRVSLAPLIVLAVFGEAAGPRPDALQVVTDSVIINAPPDYVWRYVVQYPENTSPPEYWLWRIGLPAPEQSLAEAPRVGAKRVCRFSTGAAFEERIIDLQPDQSMTFAVTKQPNDPEVLGHFRFDQGRIALTRNVNGTTTITATSWYHLYVRPAAYFGWWAQDITRQVHFRVLNHVKRLAERDFDPARRRTN